MGIANTKPFVAGALALMMFFMSLFMGTHLHATAAHYFNLVSLPAVSALCFWHAFEGQRPLLGRSEIQTSTFLGVLTLLLAAYYTFLGVRYGHKTFALLTAAIFCAAAVFYFRQALQESRSSTAPNHS
jgi:hypothetical protein